MLPEGVSIITAEQRDWDDSYHIGSGRTFCFEFVIPEGEVLDLMITHSKPTAQDLSLRCWFADKPLGDQYFPFDDSMDVFHATRAPYSVRIGASNTEEQYKMPAGVMHYFMVQNMQNSDNLFKLSFNINA